MNIDRLNNLITSSTLNKVQLAEKCLISRTTLDNVLSGSDAKISTIEALAKALGVNVGYFFDDCEPNNIAIATKGGNAHVGNKYVNDGSVNEQLLTERISHLEKTLADKEQQLQDAKRDSSRWLSMLEKLISDK
jgi:transcriptional regulator with XRE-family HTH domain